MEQEIATSSRMFEPYMNLNLNSYFNGRERTKGAKDDVPTRPAVGYRNYLCDVAFERMCKRFADDHRTASGTHLHPTASPPPGHFATAHGYPNHRKHGSIPGSQYRYRHY